MPAVQRKELFARARRATVMIARKEGNAFKSKGAGFAITRKHFGASGVIVSAAHVLSPSISEPATHIISLRMRRDQRSGNWSLTPRISEIDPAAIAVHGAHDLALTRTGIRFDANRTLELAPRNRPSIGDEVATFGWPVTSQEVLDREIYTPSALVGIISAIFPHPTLPLRTHALYLAQLPTQGGDSGGPVLSLYTGKVIGVASGRSLRLAKRRAKDPTQDDVPGQVRVGLARIAPITHVMDLTPPTP